VEGVEAMAFDMIERNGRCPEYHSLPVRISEKVNV
jgi:hypothetical protein